MFDHTTSRLCDDPACNGQLIDSIINFGENLPQGELTKAFNHAQKVHLLDKPIHVHVACFLYLLLLLLLLLFFILFFRLMCVLYLDPV